MQALIQERYGSPDVLRVDDVSMPVPGHGDAYPLRVTPTELPPVVTIGDEVEAVRLVWDLRQPVRGLEVAAKS